MRTICEPLTRLAPSRSPSLAPATRDSPPPDPTPEYVAGVSRLIRTRPESSRGGFLGGNVLTAFGIEACIWLSPNPTLIGFAVVARPARRGFRRWLARKPTVEETLTLMVFGSSCQNHLRLRLILRKPHRTGLFRSNQCRIRASWADRAVLFSTQALRIARFHQRI